LYAGIVFNLPSTRPSVWFPFSLVPVAGYSYLCFIRRQGRFSIEALVSYAVLIAGCIQFLGNGWLHILYIPFLIISSLFYRPGVIIPLSLVVPLLEIRHFMGGNRWEEAILSSVAVLTGALVSTVLSKMRGERDGIRKSLDALREEAEGMDFSAPAEIIKGEGLISQHLSATNKINEELREVLLITCQIVPADTAQMFALKGNSLHLRCSSDGRQDASLPDAGSLAQCLQKRVPVIYEPAEKNGGGHTCLAAPVMDGNFVAGLLTVQRGKEAAFLETDVRTVELFAHQTGRILKRQRIYSELQKEHLMLRKLKDGGSRLVGSLKTEDIAGSLIEAIYSIVPQERVAIAYCAPKDGKLEVVRLIGFTFSPGTIFDPHNTRMGLVCKSGELDYISDLRSERNPVLPFRIADEGSVLMLPLFYEKDFLGLVVLVSPRVNAIHPYQVELLKVLGNQASSSFASAKFHAEIEKMAVTDGLTGLFNHRHFQEKLSEEFKRMQRFGNPLSLFLVDIDFFKKINDTYGHPAGDEVLREVAGAIRETIRNVDIAARYGGEEFAVILPETNHEGAQRMAERLRKVIAERAFSLDGKARRVTVSIGVATSPYDTGSRDELIGKADQALYQAKRSGRDRCVLWKEIKE
jgi:diguanylate cyclase (GGDEF)-like protein